MHKYSVGVLRNYIHSVKYGTTATYIIDSNCFGIRGGFNGFKELAKVLLSSFFYALNRDLIKSQELVMICVWSLETSQLPMSVECVFTNTWYRGMLLESSCAPNVGVHLYLTGLV